jgi:subtilisin family serine protease
VFEPRGSIRAEGAWQKLGHYGDEKVVIGVIDGAFDFEHPDFASARKIAGFAYFEDGDLIASEDGNADRRVLRQGPLTLISHGTACAALAAAGVDNQPHSSVGVAPGCRLYLMKLPLDSMSLTVIADSQFVAAIRHLRHKVDVVTSSWEAVDPRIEWSSDLIAEVTDAALNGGRRTGKGIVFFWGAGNSDRPIANDFTSAVPVPYHVTVRTVRIDTVQRARRFVNNLVGLPNVIHVAASTSQGRRSHYSNYGYGVGLAAPSDNKDPFLTCTPAPGIPIRTSAFNGASALTGEFGGTSAASPIAAGVAALVISAHPMITATETVSILRRTAERNLDVTSQYPRAPAACLGAKAVFDVSPVHPFDDGSFKPGHQDGPWSPWFGFGRVDALAAVTEAMQAAQVVVAAATV